LQVFLQIAPTGDSIHRL